MSNRETSPSKFSTRFGTTKQQIDEAQLNLERSLRALDQRGEAGLQAELDRIYPPTGHQRKTMPDGSVHITLPDGTVLRSGMVNKPGALPLHATQVIRLGSGNSPKKT